MSPSQAAQATGTSRRTVLRAIETQDLLAFRDNRNHWKITFQALEEWASAHRLLTEQTTATAEDENSHAHSVPTPEHMVELEAERNARRLAEIEAGELRGKLAATEAERNRLHDLIERLTEPRSKRRRWWPF